MRGIMRKRRKYNREFKESAIELYQHHSEEKSAKEVADNLVLHEVKNRL
jgi:transposase-like protein